MYIQGAGKGKGEPDVVSVSKGGGDRVLSNGYDLGRAKQTLSVIVNAPYCVQKIQIESYVRRLHCGRE